MAALDLYLIESRNNRYILFCPSDLVEACEAESGDRIQRATAWLARHRNRVVRWVGKVLHAGYAYYLKLEVRIDPLERVLKAMASTPGFSVYYGRERDSEHVRQQLRSILKWQRVKHSAWFVIDLILSVVVLIFTPILAPIPGPNVFLYYPCLRLLSHYRALRGVVSCLHSSEIQFICLPELGGLEENLRAPSFDRGIVRVSAEGLKIRGLEQFLERMV